MLLIQLILDGEVLDWLSKNQLTLTLTLTLEKLAKSIHIYQSEQRLTSTLTKRTQSRIKQPPLGAEKRLWSGWN